MYVGLDLGNSVLSYCYSEDDKIKVFYASDDLPNRNEVFRLCTNTDLTTKEIKQKIDNIGQHIKKSVELLYKEENVEISTISYFVIVVPQEWLERALQEHLQQTCQGMFDCKIRIVSNITASVIYFQKKYSQIHSKYFTGHMLIYDAEKLLTISLAKVNGSNIKIVESVKSEAPISYINDIFTSMTDNIDFDNKRLEQYLFDLEYKKNQQSKKVTNIIKKYLNNDQRNQPIFYIDQYPCRPSHLCEGFNKNLAPNISSVSQEICKSIGQYNIDWKSSFEILLIGNYDDLIEQAIINCFNSKHGTFRISDKPSNFKAKGASIIAIQTRNTAPANIGLVLYTEDEYGQRIQSDEIFIEKGTPIDQCSIPNYENGFVYEAVMRDNLKERLKVFIDSEEKRHYFTLPKAREYFPNPTLGNQWCITFSVDKNKRYYINIKDKSGYCVNVEIQKLIERSRY